MVRQYVEDRKNRAALNRREAVAMADLLESIAEGPVDLPRASGHRLPSLTRCSLRQSGMRLTLSASRACGRNWDVPTRMPQSLRTLCWLDWSS